MIFFRIFLSAILTAILSLNYYSLPTFKKFTDEKKLKTNPLFGYGENILLSITIFIITITMAAAVYWIFNYTENLSIYMLMLLIPIIIQTLYAYNYAKTIYMIRIIFITIPLFLMGVIIAGNEIIQLISEYFMNL